MHGFVDMTIVYSEKLFRIVNNWRVGEMIKGGVGRDECDVFTKRGIIRISLSTNFFADEAEVHRDLNHVVVVGHTDGVTCFFCESHSKRICPLFAKIHLP